MEMKVRLVEPEQPKSAAEVENQLLEQHEESVNPTSEGESPEVVEEVSTDSPSQETREPLQEEELLSIISKRLDREINSFDDLQEAREASEEDISAMMEDFKFDEELDDESDIRKVRLAKKKTVAKAKKYFNEAKEKYRVPLESSGSPSLEEDEGYSEYKQYVANAKTAQEEQLRRKNWFVDKTSEVFGSEFKGFEFNVNDKSYVFSPGDKAELKKLQETPMNWVNRFVDEEGLIKDAVGYHRSLAIAMNPEKFAKFFYEQGQSEAVDGVMRKTKNINMSERSAPQNASTSGGMQVRSVNPDSGRGLKIRSAARTS